MTLSSNSTASSSVQEEPLKTLQQALVLANLGWKLFPLLPLVGTNPPQCSCGNPGCKTVGKHPRITSWPERATNKIAQVKNWFEPDVRVGIGVATGSRSGVWVLDLDTKNPNDDGSKTLAALEEQYGPLPDTVTVRTGSGGLHYYFQNPSDEFRNTERVIGPGIDTRGFGGYVVAPPTLHKSGNRYTWIRSPSQAPFAPVPGWLLALAKQPPPRPVLGKTPGIYSHGSLEDAKAALAQLNESKLVVWMTEHPEEVTQDAWRSIATNFAAAADGHDEVLQSALESYHNLSRDYHAYSPRETTAQFQIAINAVAAGHVITNHHFQKCGVPPEVLGDLSTAPIVEARRTVRAVQAAVHKEETPVNPSEAPPPELPLKLGSWGPKDEARFYVDEALSAYRYLVDINDPGTLSGGLSKDMILSVLTHDYKMALKAAQRLKESFRHLDGEVIDPSQPQGPITHTYSDGTIRYRYNLYAPTKFQPVKGNWDNIRQLVTNLAGGSAADVEYLLDWIAAPLQSLLLHKKLRKLRTAIAIHGDDEGAGKGTLVKLLKVFYGDPFVGVINQNVIESRFQGILVNKLLINANEVRAKDEDSEQRLKELISEDEMVVEEKNTKTRTYTNYANFIFTTNNAKPVRIKQKNRRYSVFNTLGQDTALADRIYQDFDGPRKELAAFFDELLTRKLQHNVDLYYANEARQAVVVQSEPPHVLFVQAVRTEGLRHVARNWLKKSRIDAPNTLELNPEDGTRDVSSGTLLDVYRQWARDNGFHWAGGADGHIIPLLRKEGLIGEAQRRTVHGQKYTYYSGIPFDPPGDAAPEAETSNVIPINKTNTP